MPVFYRHPHVNYRSLPSFGRCIQLPLRYTSGTKLSLVRHLTIRPSHTPAVQTIKSPVRAPSATGLRPYSPTPVYKYTVHPSLHTVCQLFSDLTSFTLKDTLVRHWSDAKLLFGSLKHLRPRKARLEIRMWDLSESLLGRDLVAASSPNVHAEFSSTGAQTFRWRMTQWATHGANWDHQAREMWQGENDRTQMMQRWRDVLLDGGELHLPAWWIEPPQPSPNFAAAAANHQHGLLGLGQANHGGNVHINNANGNNGNGNQGQGQNGMPYAMSHLPQAHPPHHTHHRAAVNGAFYPNLQTHVGGRQGGGFANTSTSTPSSYPAGAAVDLTPGSIDGISSALPQHAPVTDMHSSLLAADTGEGMSGSRDVGSSSATGSRMRPAPFLDDDNACMLDQEAFEEMLNEAEAAAASLEWPHDWLPRSSVLPHQSRQGGLSSSTSSRARSSAESTSGHPDSAQRPVRLPRGSVLLAARALGRPDPAVLINGLTSVGLSSSVSGGTSDTATRQNTQTADALERLRDLRMSQRAELTSRQMNPSTSPSVRSDSGQTSHFGLGSQTWTHPLWPRDNSSSLPAGSRPNDVSHFGGGGPRRHLAGVSSSSRNLAGAVSTRGGGDQGANTTQPTPLPLRSDLPTTSSASVLNVSRGTAAGPSEPTSQGATNSPISFGASAAVSTTPAQPDRTTLSTQSSFPTATSAALNHLPPPVHMADPLRSMRMDHIIPTEEELQQYGNDWYLHHQEPTPCATRPILRIDPSSQSSVPAPRAADTAARSVVDPDDDPSLTVTYLGVTGHALAHEMRGMLLDLLENHWSPKIQAIAFQALDPLATLVVRDPLLMFWISLGIPHIRVHLPRGINSLAIFKDAKTCNRDRHRAARRAEQAAAAAAAAVEGTAGQGGAGTAAPVHLALAHSAAANTNAAPLVGHVPGNNGNTATDLTTQQIVEDEEEERVVGGDGSGGELVHDGTRLFEIEVNTLQEMANDVGWYRAGGQLPPQVCRVLAGDRAHDWRDVRVGECRIVTSREFRRRTGMRMLIIRPADVLAELSVGRRNADQPVQLAVPQPHLFVRGPRVRGGGAERPKWERCGRVDGEIG